MDRICERCASVAIARSDSRSRTAWSRVTGKQSLKHPLGHLGHGQFEATYQHDTRCRGWLYLSLVALLILWIGTPWPYQFLMTIPFIFVAFIIRRSGKTALSMLAGILPIALLFLLFQDADHSRLYPILLVIAWVLSCIDPAESAQIKLLKHKPQQGSSCSAPGEGAGGYRSRSNEPV